MSFFMVGSFYVSIKLFYKNYFRQLTNTPNFNWKHPDLWNFFDGEDGIGFSTLFGYSYSILLIFTGLVSIATPIDRAVSYFKIIAIIFSVLTILSIVGIVAFLIGTGFWPHEKQYNPDTQQWTELPQQNFSWLTLAGVIMLSTYLVPFIMRPIDFIWNLPQYLLGMTAYLLMMPVFINVMQCYSMCNLHDISWGNRPSASSGTSALSIHDKKQQELKSKYMVFRVNFLTFWICANIFYAIIIENYAQVDDTSSGEVIVANTGQFGFLEIFATYLACLVVYRVFFGGIHILKFKILRNFYRAYKTPIVDLHQEVKRLRQTTRDWNESVVEADYDLIEEHNDYDEVTQNDIMLSDGMGPGG